MQIPQFHLKKVQKLQLILHKKQGSFCLKQKNHSNTLRNGDYKKESHLLDLSRFNQILDFDPQMRSIMVEPSISFGQLCRFTLKHHLIPPVVPEFSNITVGGAILGAAIESTSHRYGQVSDQCMLYEVVLGDGTLVYASPQKNSDLFFAISGSYGTLAILTAVQLKLIPAKPYIHLKYSWISPHEAVQKLTKPKNSESIEGIVFNSSQAAIIEGNKTEQIHGLLYHQRFPWSKWFAQHLLQDLPQEETMTTYEYIFRHDRGAFWIGRYILSFQTLIQSITHLGIPEVKSHPLNPSLFLRFLFGWYFSSKRLYRLWHRVPNSISEKMFFIHDFYIPFSNAEAALLHWMELTQIFPIWLCPVKGTETPQFLSPHYDHEKFLNIGLYGIPPSCPSIPALSAQLEKEALSYSGKKMLYSLTYYDQKAFDLIYPSDRYLSLRQKYGASVFPTLYQKVSAQNRITST